MPRRSDSMTARNRLWIAPMCMYSVFAEDGVPTAWHRVHYGSRAVGVVHTENAAFLAQIIVIKWISGEHVRTNPFRQKLASL